jgi:hypothetical protein
MIYEIFLYIYWYLLDNSISKVACEFLKLPKRVTVVLILWQPKAVLNSEVKLRNQVNHRLKFLSRNTVYPQRLKIYLSEREKLLITILI